MIPIKIKCPNCTAEKEVNTERRFIRCPYCKTRIEFPGFEYQKIDWSRSKYAAVEYWTDCPACGSPNMYLGPEGKAWLCPDCGWKWLDKDKEEGILWFCDDCETLMNIQPGFNTDTRKWRCRECGFVNDVTEENLL